MLKVILVIRSTLFVLILVTAGVISCATRTDETFYVVTTGESGPTVNITDKFGIDTTGMRDESTQVQKAIDLLAKEGGGTLYFSSGRYVFQDIKLKSNVHIKIEAGAEIVPSLVGRTKHFSVFSVGHEGSLVENVSIQGVDGRFIVKLSSYEPGIRVIETGYAKNFLYANFDVHDQLTKFSSLTFGTRSKNKRDYHIPGDGEVRNVSTFNSHYGYGMVQAQAANNVLFENLHGLGGTTLRLETGAKAMNDLQIGGLRNIVGRGISCENGNSGVMISPHSMHNGAVHIDGVESRSCGFAVRIGSGFISKKQKNPNLTVGTFAHGTSVKNVHAVFGMDAQLKSKHFKYMPLELRDAISKAPPVDGMRDIIFLGPAVAAVGNLANYPVIVENVTAEGFKYQEPVITVEDAVTSIGKK